ncbi:5'-methylthioadenosine/S-adenosylhomocysteine nucleosidase [Paracoccus sp. Z330]|uniref:5'-methylthioadenosine/S-adenosylhomocysteine nucleosidase n=1 Tax=Paracoccus onchidii TaxID=3017813 RepID=A0ABT4ZF84_9RHOB|nr:5'-methylthioadenosine/S-adenosylhomocysteine nucleosidase [Paracoccus onchidii]MDB6177767.1 5'-methylthioadenosine/S-adenosylhomocysteine nucleosidase [Paracoccus onchidii]
MPHIETISGRTVLFVMAAKPEYGPALQARIKPVMTGIGPVEAAVKLTAALAALPKTPDLVVSLGSAGSNRLEHAQVYQVSAVAYRDMDASALGFERGCTPLLDLPTQVKLPYHIPDIPSATLSTGANIVSGAAYQAIAQDMVDMETFAHLRVCQHFGTELVGLRGISDGASELQGMSDWTEYLHVIDERLAAALDRLGEAWS